MNRSARVAGMRRRLQIIVSAIAVTGLMITALNALAAAPPAPFFNGFENASDVDAGNNMTGVTRVASGTNGVVSAGGGFHAEAAVNSGAYTRYGGYSSVFPDGGFTTSIDIYLDTADSPTGADLRLDWSSAISTTTNGHRRDFIFSIGTNGSGGFVMSTSNNSPGWPGNPGRDPLTITATGWYTFQHRFYDSGGGVLAVDMSVLDPSGTVLKTWTLSNPTDVIGVTVGGNRYGWLARNAFANLAIDNITRSGAVPAATQDCKKQGWMDLFRPDGTPFKSQGDCIQYVNTGK